MYPLVLTDMFPHHYGFVICVFLYTCISLFPNCLGTLRGSLSVSLGTTACFSANRPSRPVDNPKSSSHMVNYWAWDYSVAIFWVLLRVFLGNSFCPTLWKTWNPIGVPAQCHGQRTPETAPSCLLSGLTSVNLCEVHRYSLWTGRNHQRWCQDGKCSRKLRAVHLNTKKADLAISKHFVALWPHCFGLWG